MQVIPLSEGSFTIDATKQFVPFNATIDSLQERNKGSLLVEVQPFVVITTEDILLLDTGLGFSYDGRLQLHQNLSQAGIAPSSITKVLLSHLHKDHAGGIAVRNNLTGVYEMAFPQATYYVQAQEWQYAQTKGAPSYHPEALQCFKEAGNVEWLEGNGVIDHYIKYQVTEAHAPHHQVFWIVDGGHTVFFGADDAPQLQQMKSKLVAKYDYDGKKCMQLRQTWWEEGKIGKWTFLFYHDIASPQYVFGE
jgi:glyoxylase-like metal-dependent hydrolase (beta-lactamase superfamily II)